jgi:hypothetical protein
VRVGRAQRAGAGRQRASDRRRRDSIRYEATGAGPRPGPAGSRAAHCADAGARGESAFLDNGARTLLLRAREARLRQDSALLNYDAKRVPAPLGGDGVPRRGAASGSCSGPRPRRACAGRAAGGVHVDLKGARSVFPAAKEEAGRGVPGRGDADPVLPWARGAVGRVGARRAPRWTRTSSIHPIALGAEAYYRYATGDSLTITLPDGRAIRLRELRIEPRRPEWKLSVGSFWFDVSSRGSSCVRPTGWRSPLDIWGIVDEEVASAT